MSEPTQKIMTDSEKLDALHRRVRRMETSTHIQTFLMVAGFIGIISLAALGEKLKKLIK